ncbi:uncharacterized protein CCOS01_08061, partial [Colletotrichum costaricense]
SPKALCEHILTNNSHRAWYSFDQINSPYIEVSIIVVLGFDLLLFIKIHESKFSRLRSQDETITYPRMT